MPSPVPFERWQTSDPSSCGPWRKRQGVIQSSITVQPFKSIQIIQQHQNKQIHLSSSLNARRSVWKGSRHPNMQTIAVRNTGHSPQTRPRFERMNKLWHNMTAMNVSDGQPKFPSNRLKLACPNCNSNGKVVTGCYTPAASFALFYSGKQLESLQCIRPRKQRLWPSSLEEFRLQEHPPDPHLTDRKVKAISQGQTILPLHSWACTAKDHLHQANDHLAVWQHVPFDSDLKVLL